MPTAEQKVAALMQGYDPSDSDADEIAVEISNDPEMVAVLTKGQRKILVQGLFDGPTDEGEEDAAMRILKGANKSDLNWIENQLGWGELSSELDTPDIALLRGRTGNLSSFDYTDDDSDNIASAIADHPTWLANFNSTKKTKLIRALFDGKTYASEEADALTILRSLYGSPDTLLKVIRDLGWPLLESELGTDALAELRMQTLDFKDFDYTDGFADEIAEEFAKHPSVLKKLTRGKRKLLVKALFDGDTPEAEEDAALAIMLSEPTGSGMIKLCCDVGGWGQLFSELDGDALDEIAASIAKKLDADGRIFLAEAPWLWQQLPLSGNQSGGSVQAIIDAMPLSAKKALQDKFIQKRSPLLSQIRSRLRRGQEVEEDFVLSLVFAIKHLVQKTSYRASESTQLQWEVHYTFLVAHNLYEGDYGQLVKFLPDMADETFAKEQRVAVFQVFRRFAPDFTAMGELMKKYGDSDQKQRVKRFGNVKDAFLGSFDADADAQSLLDQILAALADVGEAVTGELEDVRAMLADMAASLQTVATWSTFTGDATDDEARSFINHLNSLTAFGNINILSRLPTSAKEKLCNFCIDGQTLDEDEESILRVLTTTKKANRAEYFQLLAALSMTTLDDNIQGDQWDSFMALLGC